MERIGIYGGSFNPVHIGHILLAREALETVPLDRVLFMPAGQNPLKKAEGKVPPSEREHLLNLALESEPGMEVDTRELYKEGSTYTIDSLRELHREFPDAQLHLIIGQDQIPDLEKWKEIREVLELARPIIFPRKNQEETDEEGEGLPRTHPLLEGKNVHWLKRQFDISSTEVRKRVASSRNIRYLVPDKVVEYIHQSGLYNSL